MLSELLAAAIAGDSSLTCRAPAGTTEEHFRYGWNYSLLIARGRCPSAGAVPVLAAMRRAPIGADRGDHPVPARGPGRAGLDPERCRLSVPAAGRAACAREGAPRVNVNRHGEPARQGWFGGFGGRLKRRLQLRRPVAPIPTWRARPSWCGGGRGRSSPRRAVPLAVDDAMPRRWSRCLRSAHRPAPSRAGRSSGRRRG